mgnify:CR=1 FL=1
MFENRIRGRVVIEFTQAPNGEVRPSIEVDDWIRHWTDMNPQTMAVARVPEAVIAARILADMCHGAGIEKALEFAAAAVKKAEAMRKEIEDGKKPAACASEDARDGSVH